MDGRYVMFESFVYDRVRNTLTYRDRLVSLTPKALELLALFLVRPGELLTKDQILEELWPGEFVQEGNLSQQIYLLRKSLVATGAGDVIRTVPRRGYRLAAEVRFTDDVASGAPRRSRRLRRVPQMIGAAVLVAAAVVLGIDLVHNADRLPVAAARSAEVLSPMAEREYRLAQYYYDNPPFKELPLALDRFRKVTMLAPRSALGYAGMADTELRMADMDATPSARADHAETGRQLAVEALAVEPNSAEAHISYGYWLVWFAHNPQSAEREFQEALSIDPNDASAHLWMGDVALYNGDFARSVTELRLASRLAPTSFVVARALGLAYYYSRDYADAVPQLQQALTLYPGSSLSRLHLAMALAQSDQPARALAILEHMTTRDFNRVQLRTWIAYCRAQRGERALAVAEVNQIARSPERELVAPNSLAAVYVAAGEPREAVAVLQEAKLNVMTMWTRPESAAIIPRYDPRLALLYADGRLVNVR